MVNDELFMELSAYADGELGAERTRVLEARLHADPALRRELEQFQKLDLSAAAIPVPNVDTKLNAMAKSLRHPDVKSAADDRLNTAARHAPLVSARRFDAVWTKIAARTVAPAPAEREAMLRSALADGEFDAAQTSALPQSANFEREAKLWRKLDAAVAALPVPQLSELAGREVWHTVAEQTAALNPGEQRAIEKIECAAVALAVPAPSDEKFSACWSRIAGQLAQTPAALREELAVSGTPLVSDERWNAMWKRIASRMNTQERVSGRLPKIPPRTSNLCLPAVIETPAAIAAPEKKPVQADFMAPRKRRWGWLAVASAAAIVILAVSLIRPTPPIEPGMGSMAFVIPEVLDERYGVHVQYLQGQKEPVVCFFLKTDDAQENEVKVKDWKWLPD